MKKTLLAGAIGLMLMGAASTAEASCLRLEQPTTVSGYLVQRHDSNLDANYVAIALSRPVCVAGTRAASGRTEFDLDYSGETTKFAELIPAMVGMNVTLHGKFETYSHCMTPVCFYITTLETDGRISKNADTRPPWD